MHKEINTFLSRVLRRLPLSDIGAYMPKRSASGDR